MRAVDFEHVEARAQRAVRRLAVFLDQLLDVTDRQFARLKIAVALRDRARADDLPLLAAIDTGMALHLLAAFPRQLVARLAPRVAELDADRRAVRLAEVDDALQRRDELVLPQAEVARRGAAARIGLGRLHEDQPRAAGGEATVVNEVPVVRITVLRRIGQHRRDDDAVAKTDAAQIHRREQKAFHTFLVLFFASSFRAVMAGLDPAIHVSLTQ